MTNEVDVPAPERPITVRLKTRNEELNGRAAPAHAE
jgi:hypothetical protein